MRIILMYDFLYEPGGLERLMTIHAGYLKKAGYDVELFFGDIDRELLKAEIYKNLKVRDFGSFGKKGIFKIIFNLLGFNKLKSLIKEDDIILSYSFPCNFATRNFKNKKIFYMNHFPNYLYLPMKERLVWANTLLRRIALIASISVGPLIKFIDKRLVKSMDSIIENSHFTKKRIDSIYGTDGFVSQPPVQSIFKQVIDKKIKKKYKIKNKFIYYSGRVIPDKRTDWLIKAFSYIKDRDVELVISGFIDENYKVYLDKLSRQLGVKDKIKFLGLVPIEDLIRLYSIADVYVFPAPKEDFGLTPVEALSCGVPVITWNDNSGPTESILDGVNGLFAKPYSIKDLAEKIKKSLDIKWNRKKIVKSVENVSEKFLEEGFVKEIKRVIGE